MNRETGHGDGSWGVQILMIIVYRCRHCPSVLYIGWLCGISFSFLFRKDALCLPPPSICSMPNYPNIKDVPFLHGYNVCVEVFVVIYWLSYLGHSVLTTEKVYCAGGGRRMYVIRYKRESPLLMVGRAALYYVGGWCGRAGWLAIIPLEHVQRKINLMTKVST